MEYTVVYQTLQLSNHNNLFNEYINAENDVDRGEIAHTAFVNHYEYCDEPYSVFDTLEEAKVDALSHCFHGIVQGYNMNFLEVCEPSIMYEGNNGVMEFIDYKE